MHLGRKTSVAAAIDDESELNTDAIPCDSIKYYESLLPKFYSVHIAVVREAKVRGLICNNSKTAAQRPTSPVRATPHYVHNICY